jgi:hypothetical protein
MFCPDFKWLKQDCFHTRRSHCVAEIINLNYADTYPLYREDREAVALPGSPAVMGQMLPVRPLTLRPSFSQGLPFSDVSSNTKGIYSGRQLVNVPCGNIFTCLDKNQY